VAFVVWFTGLPGAGKTTIADAFASELERRRHVVDRLDGDVVRHHLSQGLGFSKEDRDLNVGRIAWVAARIARAGAIVVVSAIAPYEEARRHARELISREVPFVEIYVATSVEECVRRDPKGHYARALGGELENFTGISDPYEVPLAPDLRVETQGATPPDCAALVIGLLEERGLLALVPRETKLLETVRR
jgi:adenylyl-sulfate kinase